MSNTTDVKIGLYNADGIYTVSVDDIAVAELLSSISAMSSDDELAYWGGVVTDLANCADYDADSNNSPEVRVTLEQAQAVYNELLAAGRLPGEWLDDDALEEFEELFLEKWQGMGLA